MEATSGTYDDLILLTWTEVTDATYYEVYRSTSKDISGTLIDAPTKTQFMDFSIEVDTEYFYKIKAYNSVKCSDYSEVFSGYAGELPQNNTINPAIIMYLLN